ncbi:MAG: hypothetical protein ACTTHI_02715 [Prevotella sp.]
MMRTEHVKRNIDIDKAVRKTYLANCFFIPVGFLFQAFVPLCLWKRESIVIRKYSFARKIAFFSVLIKVYLIIGIKLFRILLNCNKKEMPRNEASPGGCVVCFSPLKGGILFRKILLLAFVWLQDNTQAIGL